MSPYLKNLLLIGTSTLGSHPWSEVSVTQSCPTLYVHVDCRLSGCSLHEILQARILEWVFISFSTGSSQLWDLAKISHIAGRFFTIWATNIFFYLCPIYWFKNRYKINFVPYYHHSTQIYCCLSSTPSPPSIN